jgi:Methyltransferase domain
VADKTVGAPKKVRREPDPFADFPKPSMNARAMFARLHRAFRPRTYTEIGVSKGGSLARSRTKSIGVDPAFAITAELNCDVRLFRETSDDFFARPDAFAHFDGVPVDFAYIDGMHLSEFALRDFMNMEKRMARTGMVALDDMLPRNPLEAARERRTGPWAGDVYKIHRVLETYRPDLTLVPVNVHPTGTYLVLGLDPDSTVLDEHYDEIEPALLTPDPQVVDQEWLERRTAVDPEALLELDVWESLIELREDDLSRDELASLWKRIASLEPASL